MIKKGLNVALMGVLGLAIVGCDGQQKKTSETKESINITKNMEQAVYTKKFTNKDFYKDGKFHTKICYLSMAFSCLILCGKIFGLPILNSAISNM